MKIRLTTFGVCANPPCGNMVYAELADMTLPLLLCIDCEPRHGARLLAVEVESAGLRPALGRLLDRSKGRLPTRGRTDGE